MAAKVICVYQDKGGVGKTTISRTLAVYLAQILGKRVLGIDLDPQASWTQRLVKMVYNDQFPDAMLPVVNPNYDAANDPVSYERNNSGDVFFDVISQDGILPYPTRYENLDFLPANRGRLQEVDLEATTRNLETRVLNRMHQFLQSPGLQAGYDVVVIDTPADLNLVTQSAIRASDYLVIPLILERQCVEGLKTIFTVWREQLPKKRSPIKIAGIVANMVDSKVRMHKEYFDSLTSEASSFRAYMCPHYMKQRADWKYTDLPNNKQQSIWDYPPSNDARKEAEHVFKYITNKVFTHEHINANEPEVA